MPSFDSGWEAAATVVAESIPRAIALSQASGERGTLLTVTGEGFKKQTTATVYLDADGNGYMGRYEAALATSTINDDGGFTASFTLDAQIFVPGAQNKINAKDGQMGSAETSLSFTLLGKVTVTPDRGYNGDAIEITLQDFPPNRTLAPGTVSLGDVRVNIPRAGSSNVYPKTDSHGRANFKTVLPLSTPAGYQPLSVVMPCTCPRRTAEFIVLRASLTISPHEVVANQTVVLRGTEFSRRPSPVGRGPTAFIK